MKKIMKPGDMFNAFQAKKHKMKSKNWIQSIGMKKGALHREMGVKAGNKIPAARLRAAAKKGGKLGKRARLAETLKGFHHKKGKKHRKHKKTVGMDDLSNYSKPAPAKVSNFASTTKAMTRQAKQPSSGRVGPLHLGPAQPWRFADGTILKKSHKNKTKCKKHMKKHCKMCS